MWVPATQQVPNSDSDSHKLLLCDRMSQWNSGRYDREVGVESLSSKTGVGSRALGGHLAKLSCTVRKLRPREEKLRCQRPTASQEQRGY